MSIQKKVVIAILAAGFIALSIGLSLTYFQVKTILTEAIGRDFAEIAKKSAERFDATVKEEIDTFRRLSEDPAFVRAVKEKDKDTIGLYLMHYLKHAEEREEHLAIFVVDAGGRMIEGGKLRSDSKPDQSGEAWWNVVYNGGDGKLYASDIYFEKLTGIKVFDIGIPVFDAATGRVAGGIRTMMNVDAFFHFIRDTSFGETGHGMIVDSEGTPLICSILPLVEHSMNRPLIHLVTGKEGGWGVAGNDAHGGKNSIVGFSPLVYMNSLGRESLGGHQWYTFIRQDPGETFTPVNKLLLKVLLFESILVFTLCAFGVYIVRSLLLKPMSILSEGVERIGKGNFEHKIDLHTGDEIESLAKGFNKMGDALKGFYCDLEEKIRERTAALKGSETKYKALMEQAYDAIFLVNTENGQILEVNLQAEMLTGLSSEELLSIKYWDLYPQYMVSQAMEQFKKGVKRGFTTLHDVPVRKGDGETAWVDISARIVGYNNVKVYHTVMKDITERKKEEERLSMTSEQLARSTMVMLEQDTRLEAIKQEMNSLIRHLNMSEILVVLSKAIVDLLGITKIALFEQTGEVIRCSWIHGVENKRLLQLTISTEEDDPITSAIRDLIVVKKGDRVKKSPIDRYFKDWIVFPLRGKDRVVGAFVADTSATEQGEKLLQSFVDVVAMVLEKDSVIKKAKST